MNVTNLSINHSSNNLDIAGFKVMPLELLALLELLELPVSFSGSFTNGMIIPNPESSGTYLYLKSTWNKSSRNVNYNNRATDYVNKCSVVIPSKRAADPFFILVHTPISILHRN